MSEGGLRAPVPPAAEAEGIRGLRAGGLVPFGDAPGGLPRSVSARRGGGGGAAELSMAAAMALETEVQHVRLQFAPLIDVLAGCAGDAVHVPAPAVPAGDGIVPPVSAGGDDDAKGDLALMQYWDLVRQHAVAMVRIAAHFGASVEFQESLEAVVLELAEAEIPACSDLFGNLLCTSSFVAKAQEVASELGTTPEVEAKLQALYRIVLRVEDAVRVVVRCLRAAELRRGSSRRSRPSPGGIARLGSLTSSGGGTPRPVTPKATAAAAASSDKALPDTPTPEAPPPARQASILWLQRKGSKELSRLRSGSFNLDRTELPGVAEVREQIKSQAHFLVDTDRGVCGAGPREVLVLCYKTILDTRLWAMTRLFEPISFDVLAPKSDQGILSLPASAQIVVEVERSFLRVRVREMLARTEGLAGDSQMKADEDRDRRSLGINAVVENKFKELQEKEKAERAARAAALGRQAAGLPVGASWVDRFIPRSFSEAIATQDFAHGLEDKEEMPHL